jgi:hypothetical protein
MKTDRSLFVCITGGLCCVKKSEVVFLLIANDLGGILSRSLVKIHTFVSRCIAFLFAAIRLVLRGCCEPQVPPAVIQSNHIFMIHLKRRPFPCHVKPSEPVSHKGSPLDRYKSSGAIRLIVNSASDTSDQGAVIVGIDLPAKDTGLWSVIQNFAQALGCQIIARVLVAWFGVISHSISFLGSKWSGSGEGVAIASPRPNYALASDAGQA